MTSAVAERIAHLTPEWIVALTLYGEASGASAMLREAIGGVILNRVHAHRALWGTEGPASVCLAPGQFSCWSPAGGAPNYGRVMDLARQVQTDGFVPGPILKHCLRVAWEITGDTLPDITGGAVEYYSPKAMVPPGRVPAWAVGRVPTVIIEGTPFYAEPEQKEAA